MIFGLIVIALEAVEILLSANEILKWNIIKRLISVLEDLKLKSNTIDLIRFNNIVVD